MTERQKLSVIITSSLDKADAWDSLLAHLSQEHNELRGLSILVRLSDLVERIRKICSYRATETLVARAEQYQRLRAAVFPYDEMAQEESLGADCDAVINGLRQDREAQAQKIAGLERALAERDTAIAQKDARIAELERCAQSLERRVQELLNGSRCSGCDGGCKSCDPAGEAQRVESAKRYRHEMAAGHAAWSRVKKILAEVGFDVRDHQDHVIDKLGMVLRGSRSLPAEVASDRDAWMRAVGRVTSKLPRQGQLGPKAMLADEWSDAVVAQIDLAAAWCTLLDQLAPVLEEDLLSYQVPDVMEEIHHCVQSWCDVYTWARDEREFKGDYKRGDEKSLGARLANWLSQQGPSLIKGFATAEDVWKCEEDSRLLGVYFTRNGKRLQPDRVVVIDHDDSRKVPLSLDLRLARVENGVESQRRMLEGLSRWLTSSAVKLPGKSARAQEGFDAWYQNLFKHAFQPVHDVGDMLRSRGQLRMHTVSVAEFTVLRDMITEACQDDRSQDDAGRGVGAGRAEPEVSQAEGAGLPAEAPPA